MRDIIKKIVDGDDKQFEVLIRKFVESTIYAFAMPEDEEGLTLTFLNYLLENDESIEYIPLFSDVEEVEAFVAEADDVPEGYELYEFDGDLFADVVDSQQYLMINPSSGGIVFQGAHLKVLTTAANDDEADEDEEDDEE